MNRHEVEGKTEALKGKIKRAAGDLTGDPNLHDEGVANEAAGKTKDAFGHAKRKVGAAVEDIGKATKK
jgi:uncharacterized protein YjbJ (UPF0337 family)